MPNIQDVLGILQVNAIDKNASSETVTKILTQLQYSDADQQNIIQGLKTQGWFSNGAVPPAQPTAPVAQPAPTTPEPILYPTQKASHGKLLAFVVVFIILIAGISYAFVEKIGPFAGAHYTEENFSSSLVAKIAEIKTSSYLASVSLDVVARDGDAEPFALKKVSNTEELRKQYFYDSERANDVKAILGELGYAKTYPTSLTALKAKAPSYYGDFSISDPLTKKTYGYKVTNGGKDFALTVDFSTDAAIRAIRNSTRVSTTTIIQSKKVTFTKNSYAYFYVPVEPPKPLLVKLGESMQSLPPDIHVTGSFGISTEVVPEKLPNWLANVNAEGNFGDLTYKVSADAIKKGENYYFKINNIPSLFFFGDLSALKGKWVKVSDDTSGAFSLFGTDIPRMEKEYKENRERTTKLLKKLVSLADQEKLITFKTNPESDRVDGRQLTKYELSLRKEAIVPFYQKLQAEINTDPDLAEFKNVVDQGLIEYLQSDEFNEVFAYVDKHNSITLWTDGEGYPAIIANTMRIVPPDTATQLKGKQVNLVFKLVIDDINESVNIEEPKDSVSMDEVTAPARTKAKAAAVKSYLSSIRASAEVAYNKGQSYGKNPFPLGPCKATANTLFADKNIMEEISAPTDNNMSKATCVSTGTVGKVSAYAVSLPLPDAEGYSWCVDSKGNSKQILGKITSASCK